MTEVKIKERSIGEQMYKLLESKPEHYDVAFSVGPEKKIVKAVRFVLKAASSIFEQEFEGNWENATLKKGEGIPLPDLDPEAFQLFIKLLIQDRWSLNDIRRLNLSADFLLSLLEICRRFGITKAQKNIQDVANEFIRSFNDYKETEDFLKMSETNLETFLSREEILMDETKIFEAACTWAEYQCGEKNIKPNDTNIREVLGKSLYKIRFPIMSNTEFTTAIRSRNVLTAEEKLAVYEYIGLKDEEKATYNTAQLLFKTKERVVRLDLCQTNLFPFAESPAFACNGTVHQNNMKTSRKVALHGIGFLAPSADSNFDVTVEVKRFTKGNTWSYSSGKIEKRISAKKGKVFYFYLDEPVIMDPIVIDSNWNEYYSIFFSLMGSTNLPRFTAGGSIKSVVEAGTEVQLNSWDAAKPVSEIVFKKL